MNMKRSIFVLAFLATMFAGCQTEPMNEPLIVGSSVFDASTEVFRPQTKTSMTQDKQVVWSQNDRLAIFQGCTVADEFLVTDSSDGKTNGTFNIVSDNSEVNGSFSAGTEVPCNVAIYPYAGDLSLSGASIDGGTSYKIEGVVLPAVQNYVSGSFGNCTFPMVAVTETMADHNLKFKNVLGAMKLQLKGTQTVKSIRVEGNNGEKLSGTATITAYIDGLSPAIIMTGTDDAAMSVTLNCGDGVHLDESISTEFFVSLPPVLFSKGFKVTVTDAGNKEHTINTDAKNEVLRSSLLIMPVIELEPEPQEGDYVDEYGINHGQGVKIGSTIWAPVNCGYHRSDFKYGKLYQWGRQYGQGYSGQLYVSGSLVGEYSDAVSPVFEEGGVDPEVGNMDSNKNVFYIECPNWATNTNNKLWNGGTESQPVKTQYDPCPYGWRVPTYSEMSALVNNMSSWTTDEDGQEGCWFSGPTNYSSEVPQVFFPAAGYHAYEADEAAFRGVYGAYWTSKANTFNYYYSRYCDYSLFFYDCDYSIGTTYSSFIDLAIGKSVRCVLDESVFIKVESVTISETSMDIRVGDGKKLSVVVSPSNAVQPILWSSSDTDVVVVDGTGHVTAVSVGNAMITVAAGDKSATCAITVNPPITMNNYIDEYGVNHGKGIKMGDIVWAPVNCGYHKNDFKYGKLYQWGRKYGQGYKGTMSDGSGNNTGEYSDSTYPSGDNIVAGPVDGSYGYDSAYKDVFFLSDGNPYDWASKQDFTKWNIGTEESPIKNTEFDPCPEGWRIPSYNELRSLTYCSRVWGTDDMGILGCKYVYTDEVGRSSQIFMPAAGYNYGGVERTGGRGYYGFYWTSYPSSRTVYTLRFTPSAVEMHSETCSSGMSVRCVQE